MPDSDPAKQGGKVLEASGGKEDGKGGDRLISFNPPTPAEVKIISLGEQTDSWGCQGQRE